MREGERERPSNCSTDKTPTRNTKSKVKQSKQGNKIRSNKRSAFIHFYLGTKYVGQSMKKGLIGAFKGHAIILRKKLRW